MNPLVLIVGPTGSGKSALALTLAQEFNGAILNCDSLQAYQRLDIGTAKPTLKERTQVPHFLFDIIPPGQVLTAGDYRRLALDTLQQVLPERMVFGVGGSGFYIQALLKGMFEVAKPNPVTEQCVRLDLEKLGLNHLYEELTTLDPSYAETLSPNDSYRIVRALTIIRDSGRLVSELKNEFSPEPFPFPLLKLGVSASRSELLPRVMERTKAMIQKGLVDEVKALIHEGHRAWPALLSVGYKESMAYINGQISEVKLVSLIVEKTLQLAKKQRTWFKRDLEINWLPIVHPENVARDLVRQFLDRQS